MNSYTGILTINALISNVGTNSILVTAVDTHGATFTQPLLIIINSVPVISESISALSATANIAFAKILSPTLFTDVDKQNLVIKCT